MTKQQISNMNTYLDSLKTKAEQKAFVERFIEYSESIDEPIFQPISFCYIKSIFDYQKRWAGVWNYIFINDDGTFRSSPRQYGCQAD